jgi:hypothetical protein
MKNILKSQNHNGAINELHMHHSSIANGKEATPTNLTPPKAIIVTPLLKPETNLGVYRDVVLPSPSCIKTTTGQQQVKPNPATRRKKKPFKKPNNKRYLAFPVGSPARHCAVARQRTGMLLQTTTSQTHHHLVQTISHHTQHILISHQFDSTNCHTEHWPSRNH